MRKASRRKECRLFACLLTEVCSLSIEHDAEQPSRHQGRSQTCTRASLTRGSGHREVRKEEKMGVNHVCANVGCLGPGCCRYHCTCQSWACCLGKQHLRLLSLHALPFADGTRKSKLPSKITKISMFSTLLLLKMSGALALPSAEGFTESHGVLRSNKTLVWLVCSSASSR